LIGRVAASEKRGVSAAEVEPVRLKSRSEISWFFKESDAEAAEIHIERKAANVILARQSKFDALLAQKYAHVYDQSAIAD
jgi:hypothetical protein